MPYSTLWFSMLPLFKNQHLQKLVKKKSSRSVQYFSNYWVLLYSHIHTTYILKYLISNNGCRLHLKYIIELRLYRLNSTLLSITYNIISYHLSFFIFIYYLFYGKIWVQFHILSQQKTRRRTCLEVNSRNNSHSSPTSVANVMSVSSTITCTHHQAITVRIWCAVSAHNQLVHG